MSDENQNLEFTKGTMERIEPYGLYLKEKDRVIIVLIPDVSLVRVPDLAQAFQVGQVINVKILECIEKDKIFKGTMIF